MVVLFREKFGSGRFFHVGRYVDGDANGVGHEPSAGSRHLGTGVWGFGRELTNSWTSSPSYQWRRDLMVDLSSGLHILRA